MDAFSSMLSAALGRTPDAHEACCLASILRDFAFTLERGVTLGPFSATQSAEILGAINAPLPLEEIAALPSGIPASWESILEHLWGEDRALTNHDRTTKVRLLEHLRSGTQFHNISNQVECSATLD